MIDEEMFRPTFERWAQQPPREWGVDRFGPNTAWPGNYTYYHVESAWEAFVFGLKGEILNPKFLE